MAHRLKALLASIVTMAVVTITGVMFVFKPLAEGDTASAAWSPPIALAVYLALSVLLFDWAARQTRNAYTAAIVIASAQVIIIIDLLSRGERGVLTAVAGAGLTAITWLCVAFVYSKMNKDNSS